MNKLLKKTIEAELASLISSNLVSRNKSVAAQLEKNIRAAARSLAKKFVKKLPASAPAKKKGKRKATPVKKKRGAPRKTTRKKVSRAKK